METKLNDTDFAYFDEARRGLEQANAIWAMVQRVLTLRYNLQQGDSITPTGEILRLTNPVVASTDGPQEAIQ